VSVIELSGALASLKERPRRSIVFMTVFGEEKGLLGSRYYARHPRFPLSKTIANINLEHIGRTDWNGGPQLNNATFTGFTFSDIPATFQAAGEMTGVRIYDAPDGDDFFNRSDNVAFANAGIPAHTVCVSFEFPDYHGVGDHWDKIDYDNMARINRAFALGLYMLAGSESAPKWNAENSKTERYRSARSK
jgi:Zn-dependent M28 family amino/carboxypeptidase